MLEAQNCRARQKRLLTYLQQERLDAAVVALPHHAYYFSGHLPGRAYHAAFILFADGRSWLGCANQAPAGAAADQVVCYQADWLATHRAEQASLLADLVVAELVQRHAARVAVDAAPVNSQLTLQFHGACTPLDPVLWQLRRVKDADELSVMKKAIVCAEAMYRRARQIVAPGIEELEMFNQLHAAAVQAAGQPLGAPLGNDFACGCMGGPPRSERAAQAGEIYILDLGPWVDGYSSDTCRALAVSGHPTDKQMRAWQTLTQSLALVERLARPGVRCREIFAAVDEQIRAAGYPALPHHLGHGVGLQGHEAPHLNPNWDDSLLEGEVFTAEPGIYLPELAGGIRLENQYLVQAGGVVNCTPFALELA